MKLSQLIEGAYVVKNKDGKEKRFKDHSSDEAKAWAASSSPKKVKAISAPKYSAAWWEQKYEKDLDGDETVVYPWDAIRNHEISDSMNDISERAGFVNVDDWNVTSQMNETIDGLRVRTAKLRVTFYIGPEDDMGVDELTSDSQYITVRRDVKNPRVIMFHKFN